jgi:hypothetical protein
MPSDELLIVRHEDLHLQYSRVRRRVCSFLNIKDDPALDDATVLGHLWDGHFGSGTFSRTNVRSSRPDKVFAKDDWKRDLSSFHLSVIQFWLGASLRRFRYPRYQRSGPGKTMPKPYEDLIRHLFIFLKSRLHDRFVTSEGLVRFFVRIKNVPPLRWLFILWLHTAGVLSTAYMLGLMYIHYLRYKLNL